MTIQAKDVRRFNLLSIENHTELATVIEIKEKTLRLEYIRKDTGLTHRAVIEIERIKGIPLTEEWLLKFGFVKQTDTIPYNYRIHKTKMFFYIRYGKYTTDGMKTYLEGFNGLFIGNKFTRVIKHVHDLQNLYHALTNQELELKINE
jgi:hypothetical protein